MSEGTGTATPVFRARAGDVLVVGVTPGNVTTLLKGAPLVTELAELEATALSRLLIVYGNTAREIVEALKAEGVGFADEAGLEHQLRRLETAPTCAGGDHAE